MWEIPFCGQAQTFLRNNQSHDAVYRNSVLKSTGAGEQVLRPPREVHSRRAFQRGHGSQLQHLHFGGVGDDGGTGHLDGS